MSIRTRLIHRATVERDSGVARDPLGGRIPDRRLLLGGSGALPCLVQPRTDVSIKDGEKVINKGVYVMWAARDADLKVGDIITKVANLREEVLFPEGREVKDIVRRRDHLEAHLEEYR